MRTFCSVMLLESYGLVEITASKNKMLMDLVLAALYSFDVYLYLHDVQCKIV